MTDKLLSMKTAIYIAKVIGGFIFVHVFAIMGTALVYGLGITGDIVQSFLRQANFASGFWLCFVIFVLKR